MFCSKLEAKVYFILYLIKIKCVRQQGATEQELLRKYPGLSLEDLTAVWGYYYNHRSEIDCIIASIDKRDVL